MRIVTLLGVLLLAGCAGGLRGDMSAPERRSTAICVLNLWHKASNERLRVVYCAGARYRADALAKLNRFFRDRNTGEVAPIDPELYDFIAGLRDRMALSPETPIEITSGYRSPRTNEALRARGAAKESLHTQGRAADIRLPGVPGKLLAEIAKTMQYGGAAWYPRSDHVHLDTGDIRTWKGK